MLQKKIGVIMVAGGIAQRFGQTIPKQYQKLGSSTIIECALRHFIEHESIDFIQIVIHPDHQRLYDSLHLTNHPKVLAAVHGGNTRQQSVYRGLQAVQSHMPTHIMIHDAARPMVSHGLITRVLDALLKKDQPTTGIVPCLDIPDTLRWTSTLITKSPPERQMLQRVQTPQAFPFSYILKAHKSSEQKEFSDDASLYQHHGYPIETVMGEEMNIKVTKQQDLNMINQCISNTLNHSSQEKHEFSALNIRHNIRIGNGWDVHAFYERPENAEDPDPEHPHMGQWLGGIYFKHCRKLIGHSDADVILHAVTDAILGALGLGDIGQHFPNTDPMWKNASSSIFLKHAVQALEKKCYKISNLDVTVLGEEPKISPERHNIQNKLSELTKTPITNINIKATTTESLGFLGRGEGLACQALVLIVAGVNASSEDVSST